MMRAYAVLVMAPILASAAICQRCRGRMLVTEID